MSDQPIFHLDIFAELSAELGSEDASDLLLGFLAETATKLEALSGESRGVMKRHAHTLKGTAATFGFMRMASAAKDLEAIAESAEAPDLQACVERLVTAFDESSALARAQLAP